MKRLRSFWLLRASFALVLIGGVGCAPSPDAVVGLSHDDAGALLASDIVALRWLGPGADPVAFLTMQPDGCERPSDNLAVMRVRALGKAAFESPALLGGAAARAGISCGSCHLNGRGNPNFVFAGVSGDPGTADITSNIFSKVLGDGAVNPVLIPDLALRDGGQILDRSSDAFRDKVHALIVDEFDGQEPTPFVFAAVLAYLDGLDSSVCDPEVMLRTNVESSVLPALNVLLADEGGAAIDHDDPEVALFFHRVARERLGRIHERLVGEELAAMRAQVRSFSRELQAREGDIRAGRVPVPFNVGDWERFEAELAKVEDQTFYDPEVLRAALIAEGYFDGR